MHESRREDATLSGAEHSAADDAFDPFHFLRLMKPIKVHELIKQRREAGDGCCEQKTARSQDSPRLPQTLQPIALFDEVVERAPSANDVHTLVRLFDARRFAQLGVNPSARAASTWRRTGSMRCTECPLFASQFA